MIWELVAAAQPQLQTGNPILDSTGYFFGVGAFIIIGLVFALIAVIRFFRGEIKYWKERADAAELRYDNIQTERLKESLTDRDTFKSLTSFLGSLDVSNKIGKGN